MSASIGWFLAHPRMSRSQSSAVVDVGASTGASIRTSPLCRSTSTQPRSPTTSPESISLFSQATPGGPSRMTRVPRARLVRLSRLDLRAFVASLDRVSVNHYRVEGAVRCKRQRQSSKLVNRRPPCSASRSSGTGSGLLVLGPGLASAAMPCDRNPAHASQGHARCCHGNSFPGMVSGCGRPRAGQNVRIEQTGVAMMACRAFRRSQWQPACRGPGTRKGTEIPCVHGATLLAFRTRNITGRQ